MTSSFNSFMAQEIANLRTEIAELKGQRVTYLTVQVTSVNSAASTFGAAIPDSSTGGTVNLTGIASPAQFLPNVGDTVTLALSGAQLVYQPVRLADQSVTSGQIADGAVGTNQIAPASVTSVQLGTDSVGTDAIAFNLWDYSGAFVYYGPTEPAVPNGDDFHAGDLWLQDTGDTGADGQPLYLTYRWNGSDWLLLQDQGISQALADAASAQATAVSAADTATLAAAAVASKITLFFQSTPPSSGMNTGDLWVDSDDHQLYRYNGSSWLSIQDTSIATAVADAAAAADAATNAQATADGKMTIYTQPVAPVTANLGDMWIDTDDGNKVYFWQTSTTAYRQNLATNSSFEFNATGTVSSVTNWTNFASGSLGTLTRSIVTSPGVSSRNKAAQSSSSSQAATVGVGHGFSQIVTGIAAGDIVRAQADFTVVTTGANFVPYLLIEPLNGSGSVLSGSVNTSGSGTLTSTQTLAATTAALPVGTASVRITLQRRTAATTGSALTTSGIIIDSVVVEKNRPSNALTTYFDGASGGEAAWDGVADLSSSHTWQEGTPGAAGWKQRLIRTAAIEPKSLIAKDVVATGTVTAALLEALVVLANQAILAGNPNGDHSVLDQNGFHVFQLDPDNQVTEVGRLGTGADDFLGIGDDTGHLVAAIDDAGVGSFSGLVVTDDPVFMGTPFTQWISGASNIGSGNPGMAGQTTAGVVFPVSGVFNAETGILEVPVTVSTARWYLLGMELSYSRDVETAELRVRLRDGGTSTPTLASTVIMYRQDSRSPAGYSTQFQSFGMYLPGTTGVRRLLLTVESVSGNCHLDTVNAQAAIYCLDMGPRGNINNSQLNGGGGGTPVPPQQYFNEASPSSWFTYRGDNTQRTDTTDVVQGNDPTGVNGIGKGHWRFSIPSMTNTVDRVDWYVYTNHTYYNSGGTALWNLSTQSAVANPTKLQTDNQVGGYPKPGAKTIRLPSTWNATFKNKSGITVTAGPPGTADEQFYCRFDGSSARLRTWFTQ